MSPTYAFLAEVKQTLSLGGESYADADLTLALEAASRGIDNFCRRRFWPDEEPVERLYSPVLPYLLEVDDVFDLVAVETRPVGRLGLPEEFVALPEGAYNPEPLNARVDGRPFETLRTYDAMPVGHATVRVTGRFGWEEVPDAIRQATILLAVKLMRRAREAPLGIVMGDMDGLRVAQTDPDVAFLAGPYRRHTVVVA